MSICEPRIHCDNNIRTWGTWLCQKLRGEMGEIFDWRGPRARLRHRGLALLWGILRQQTPGERMWEQDWTQQRLHSAAWHSNTTIFVALYIGASLAFSHTHMHTVRAFLNIECSPQQQVQLSPNTSWPLWAVGARFDLLLKNQCALTLLKLGQCRDIQHKRAKKAILFWLRK